MHACVMPASESTAARPRRAPLPKPEGKEPLQIRIPVSVKRQFKSRAALCGLEPNELFVEIWAYYEANHSTPADKEST
jgi:hypothetical protein